MYKEMARSCFNILFPVYAYILESFLSIITF